MGPCGVVDVLEFVELGLELSDGRSGWLGCEPPFLGLVEPLDFALGLGVPRGTVLLADVNRPGFRSYCFPCVAVANTGSCSA